MREKQEFQRFYPQLREVKSLSERFSRYGPSLIRQVLNGWADRRPLEVKLEVIEEVFVNVKLLKRISESVISYLRDRDWRGAIVSVVGEYGSGKSQLGHMLLRAIRMEGEASAKFIVLNPIDDVREIFMREIEIGEKPMVIIVDEIDQLLRDLEKGRREKFEDLADMVRWFTEGHYGKPPAGSVILLMSKRAKEGLSSDRALANRLLERSREFRLSMSDEEREKASVEAVKKVIALQMAYDEDRKVVIQRNFPVIYKFLENRAREVSLVREVGGILKNIVDLMNELIINMDETVSIPSGVELGTMMEELIKDFLSRELRAIPFKVRLGDEFADYLATFSTERLNVPGAITDAHYVIWTYDPQRGKRGDTIIGKVAVEIKYGTHWMHNRDQILKILSHYPLLMILVADLDPEDRSRVEVEIRRGGRRFGLISLDPYLFKAALLLREEYRLQFLRERSTLRRDLREVMGHIMTPEAVKQILTTEGEISKDKLLRAAASSVLSSLIRELKAGRHSKRITTLSNVIINSFEAVYSGANITAPVLPAHIIDKVLRILVREGLGRFSKTGKSFMLSKESRLLLEELERDDERRRRVESVIYDILAQSKEVRSQLA